MKVELSPRKYGAVQSKIKPKSVLLKDVANVSVKQAVCVIVNVVAVDDK